MEQILTSVWSLWELLKAPLAVLGTAGITIVMITTTAFGLFKWLGEKWIDQKFEKQMEAYKTEQSRELEKLRHRINAVFNRTIRLHSKEFEVLPELWGKLVDAHGWAWGYLNQLQSYPNVGLMGDDELREFLDKKTFSIAQKNDIKNSSNKLNKYIEIEERYKYFDVMNKIIDFNLSFRKCGIFVKPEIKADMDAMFEIIHNAVTERRLNQEDKPHPRLKEASNKLKTDGKTLFEKIETAIAERLWESTTTEV